MLKGKDLELRIAFDGENKAFEQFRETLIVPTGNNDDADSHSVLSDDSFYCDAAGQNRKSVENMDMDAQNDDPSRSSGAFNRAPSPADNDAHSGVEVGRDDSERQQRRGVEAALSVAVAGKEIEGEQGGGEAETERYFKPERLDNGSVSSPVSD